MADLWPIAGDIWHQWAWGCLATLSWSPALTLSDKEPVLHVLCTQKHPLSKVKHKGLEALTIPRLGCEPQGNTRVTGKPPPAPLGQAPGAVSDSGTCGLKNSSLEQHMRALPTVKNRLNSLNIKCLSIYKLPSIKIKCNYLNIEFQA